MDFTFNVAKGRSAYYASLPGTNDALIVVLLQAAGLDTDDDLADFATLAAVLGGNDECDATGYVRKTLTGVNPAVDNVNNWFTTDSDDVLWSALGNTATAAGSGAGNNILGKLVVGYDPDTTTGTDSSVIPVWAFDFNASTDGNDLSAIVPVGGFLKVTN